MSQFSQKLREHIEDVEGSGFVSGFSDVIVAPSVAEGFRNLIQTIGMGSLRPNLVIMRCERSQKIMQSIFERK